MKNKLKIAICVVMTCVFMLIPFSAFAYYDNPSPKMLYDIANGTGKTIYSGYQLMCEDANNYYFWTTGAYAKGSGTPNIWCAASTNSYPCNLKMGGGQAAAPVLTNVFIFPKSNIYDVTVKENSHGYYYDHEINKLNNITKILYSNKDITYKKDNEWPVFFQKMNSVPKTPGNRVPLNTQLSSIQLTGTLSELIAMLPILLPVLITLLAIRKGIGFTLTILRTA